MVERSWTDLFSSSSFIYLKKDSALTSGQSNLKEKIIIPSEVHNFHPQRREEFILGRLCSSLAFKDYFKQDLFDLPVSPDRSPLWPRGVLGSITHSKNFVGAAVSESTRLHGIGIDFEEIGRTKIELSSHIRGLEDVKSHKDFTTEELLTLIFSFKESLYKALYPQVKIFFGFHDAAVCEIDSIQGEFKIKLLKDLSQDFKVGHCDLFTGKFSICHGHCLSVLEITK